MNLYLSGSARRADVVADERPDRRLELLETRETAFEQVARGVSVPDRKSLVAGKNGIGCGMVMATVLRCPSQRFVSYSPVSRRLRPMRQIVAGLQNQRFEHQHAINRRPAAFRAVRAWHRAIEIRPEQLEIHHRIQAFQAVALG
jgi:hypothetical protein